MALKKRREGGGKASRTDFGANIRSLPPVLYCFACEPPMLFAKGEFETVFSPYRHDLFKLALFTLGNYDDANDALQEALIKAWRGWHKFRGESSARTWIFKILSNHMLDLLRQPRRTESLDSLDGDWREADPVEVEDDRPRLDDIVSDRFDLQRALDTLPAEDRLMLELNGLGFSVREIADMFEDVSHTTVWRSITRSRARLSALLRVVDPAEAVAIAEAAASVVAPTNEPTVLEVAHLEEPRRD